VAATGANAVLCLAFPLQPTGRRGATPAESRLPELDAVDLPTLVVQGERDPFGLPPPGPRRRVVTIPGTHSLRSTGTIAGVVGEWLELTRDSLSESKRS
jgi:predicted alpha/beta-hydrolase family hydrolase